MQLTHLSLTDFRNYARLDVNVPAGPILFVGGNAQGKTSLLEAVYYLATFVSFQASHDRQLVNLHAEREPVAVAKIIAHFVRTKVEKSSTGTADASFQSSVHTPGNHTLEVRLILQPSASNNTPRLRKEILLDGVKRKTGDAIGAFNAVLFLPHMLRVVEGPPEERRRYLNLLLVQVQPRYAKMLSDYNRCLTQRNALLKQLGERGGDQDQLDYWDEQLTTLGAYLIFARIHAIQALEILASRMHNELTREQEVLRLSYQPSYEPLARSRDQFELPMEAPLDRSGLSLEKIQRGFIQRLKNLRGEEIARGVTTVGPHRDEFRLLGNGIDLGIYGSRGQARTAVLSLKLAEVSWMKEKTGQWPVLLLDEVLAELDPERRYDLLTRLFESEQAMLTTTDLGLFSDEFVQTSTLWRIHAGQLQEERDGT
jgi:DNA replication and repair protein RecF